MNCTNEELLGMIISVANGCGITSESNELTLLRDEALARMQSAQQSVQPTLLKSPREQTRCDCASCQQELSELPQSG